MFHYVKFNDASIPYSRHYDMATFKQLLESFSKNKTQLTTFSEYAHNPEFQANASVLTFDDGLADHYEVALYLSSKGIKATFYPISLPYLEVRVAPVHLIHRCVAEYGDEILGLFVRYCKQNSIILPELDKLGVKKFTNIYDKYDTPSRAALFKKIFNFYITDKSANSLLQSFCNHLGISIDPSNYYLTTNQIQDIHEMGHEIGCHGHSHRPLSALSEVDVHAEVAMSKKMLEDIIGNQIFSFCYPYGTTSSFTDKTIQTLKSIGFTNACTAEAKSDVRCPVDDRLFRIPRLDIAFLPTHI